MEKKELDVNDDVYVNDGGGQRRELQRILYQWSPEELERFNSLVIRYDDKNETFQQFLTSTVESIIQRKMRSSAQVDEQENIVSEQEMKQQREDQNLVCVLFHLCHISQYIYTIHTIYILALWI